jgi:hypothetical protein
MVWYYIEMRIVDRSRCGAFARFCLHIFWSEMQNHIERFINIISNHLNTFVWSSSQFCPQIKAMDLVALLLDRYIGTHTLLELPYTG